MAQFGLIKQHPRPGPKTKAVMGVLSIGKDGTATFFSDDGGEKSHIIAELERPRIEFAATHGIFLSGVEFTGNSRSGEKKYRFQEWWLIYADYVNQAIATGS